MGRNCNTLIASLLQFILLFSSLAGRCRAQVDDSGDNTTMIVAISLPFAIFFAVLAGVCIVFWACYYRVSQLAKRPHCPRRPRYIYNYPRRQQQNMQPPQNRTTSNGQSHTSTVYSNPPANSTQTGFDSPTTITATTTTTVQSTAQSLGPPLSGAPAQAYSGQDHHINVSPSIPSTSSGTTTQSSQIVPQATSEPDSLPEAALHQGDAPPAYEEAVGMKTVVVIDET